MRDPDGMIVLASDKFHRVVRAGAKTTVEVEADKVPHGLGYGSRWEHPSTTRAAARKFLAENMPGHKLGAFDGWTHYRRFDGRSASARIWIVERVA